MEDTGHMPVGGGEPNNDSSQNSVAEVQRNYSSLMQVAQSSFCSQVDIVRRMVQGTLPQVPLFTLIELIRTTTGVTYPVDDTLIYVSKADAVLLQTALLRQLAIDLFQAETLDELRVPSRGKTVEQCLNDGDLEPVRIMLGLCLHGGA